MDNDSSGEGDWSDSSPEPQIQYHSFWSSPLDRHIPGQSKIKYLNYAPNYAPSWGLSEAFRELYQNWRDGILETFKTAFDDPAAFKPTYIDRDRRISIEAFHPRTDELLGFILFEYDKDGLSKGGMNGGLRIVNFGTHLPFSALRTGTTTKYGDSRMTGQHGEGLKLAALVFRRNGYNMRVESACFKWNMIWKYRELACQLTRISDEQLDKHENSTREHARTTVHHPGKDVCLVVAAEGRAMTQFNGEKTKGKRMAVEVFRELIKVTLDINPPNDMVRVSNGDLILDESYKNKMYLKRLLLKNGGASGKPYAYSYNFADGHTTRDRNAIKSSEEEAKAIAAIWENVILATDANPELLTKYTKLLLDSFNQKGDVMLNSETNSLSARVAKKVWEQMFRMTRVAHGRPPYFYSPGEGNEAGQIIEHSLKQNPVPLDPEFWKILRQHKLCRTPREELYHRFSRAAVVEVPTGSFSTHVDRALRCCLQSHPATKEMRLEFAHGEQLALDAAYLGTTWRIHDKWLTYVGAHENTYCEEHIPDEQHLFACDHAVLHLWNLMISQLSATGGHPQVATNEAWLQSMARTRLLQMPRAVRCTQNEQVRELMVKWKSVDSHQNQDKLLKITLHRSDCKLCPYALEHPSCKQITHRRERSCDCPTQTAHVASDGVTFQHLDSSKKYTPSVSRDAEGAFVAIPPVAVQPRGQDLIDGSWPTVASKSQSAPTRIPNPALSGAGATSPIQNPVFPRADGSPYEDDNRSEFTSSHVDGSELWPDDVSVSSYRPSEDISSSRMSSVARRSEPEAHDNNTGRLASRPKTPANRDEIEMPPPAEDFYLLGERIEHNTLDWGNTFPGSHIFYRTRNKPNEDIYVLKPKPSRTNANGKRERNSTEMSTPARRPRTSMESHRSRPTSSTPNFITPDSRPPTLQKTSMMGRPPSGLKVERTPRDTANSMTPLPEGGITYRY